MTILITGALGNIGARLMRALPATMGIDRLIGSDFQCDLIEQALKEGPVGDTLATANAVIHLATSANPDAPESQHYDAIVGTTRLVQACAAFDVPRLVLASSDWAEPKNGMSVNAYAISKRVIENLAAMYNLQSGRKAVALRIGWVPRQLSELNDAQDWLLANYWDDERLLDEINNALTG